MDLPSREDIEYWSVKDYWFNNNSLVSDLLGYIDKDKNVKINSTMHVVVKYKPPLDIVLKKIIINKY